MSAVTDAEAIGETLPLVTVAIPMLNEEQRIGACLESVASGNYPLSRIELLVVDGGSDDGSVAVAQQYADRFPSLRVINNPARIQAVALNMAIEAARGQYFVRLDAHTTYGPEYVMTVVSALRRGVADNVGGIQNPVGVTAFQKLVAVALRSPVSMGRTAHRYSTTARYVETVYLGAWKIETLRELGGFNADWRVAEDYELNIRLRRKGGRVMVLPELRCDYYVRATPRSLVKQHFMYGLWRMRTILLHPKELRLRNVVPTLLVLGLAASLVAAPFYWALALVVPGLYLSIIVAATIVAARRGRGIKSLTAAVVFPLIHLSYGVGFLVGIALQGPVRHTKTRTT